LSTLDRDHPYGITVPILDVRGHPIEIGDCVLAQECAQAAIIIIDDRLFFT